jgi:flagellar hook-associated protein 3 FlgL
MRVTFGSIFRNGLIDINRTSEDLARRQREVSSGKRIHAASDDPSAMSTAMGERVEMATLDQFTRTSDSVESRLTVVDTVYTDILNRLTNVQTRAAGGRNSFLTQTQRDALAGEIRGAASAILGAVNTSYQGMYLFSGGQSLTPPYTPGPPVSAYQGDANVQLVDVARGRPVQVTFDAGAIFQGAAPTDMFQSLEALATAVQTGDMAGIDQGLAEIGAAFDRVTNAQTQIGIELARLPEDRARLVGQRDAADERRSKAVDANLAEAIAAMTEADQAHRAALGAFSNAARPSLMDYLK